MFGTSALASGCCLVFYPLVIPDDVIFSQKSFWFIQLSTDARKPFGNQMDPHLFVPCKIDDISAVLLTDPFVTDLGDLKLWPLTVTESTVLFIHALT